MTMGASAGAIMGAISGAIMAIGASAGATMGASSGAIMAMGASAGAIMGAIMAAGAMTASSRTPLAQNQDQTPDALGRCCFAANLEIPSSATLITNMTLNL